MGLKRLTKLLAGGVVALGAGGTAATLIVHGDDAGFLRFGRAAMTVSLSFTEIM